MKLPNKLDNAYHTQCQLFADNAEDILQSNLEMMRRLISIATIILSFCLIVSLLGARYTQRLPLYIICLACCLVLFLFFHNDKHKQFTLAGLYTIFAVFLSLTIYLSTAICPTYTAASIIGLYCLMPSAILDRSWRINLMTVLFFCTHVLFAWIFKLPSAASDDTLNGLCFVILGTLFGEYMRSIKLENYEMKRQAQIQTDHDFLTGLYNRRKMFDCLEKLRSSCGGTPVTGLIMLDIDHFKGYNDRLGHLAGDDCLRRLGAGFQEFGAQQGLDFFRYGGEEFLAFCYGCSHAEIGRLAEDLRVMVWELNIPFPETEYDRVTISLGFAQAEPNGGTINEQLINMADKALYQAKEKGRNRVEPYAG